jgi:small GTP-binding protein
MCDYIFKLLTLGETTVGKTSILNNYLGNEFREHSVATIGVEFQPKIIDIDQRKIKLIIYDTSGQERFKTIVSNYYKNAHGIVFVFDVTQKNTFELVEYWIKQAKENTDIDFSTCVLFGNKTDLETQRMVTYEEGKQLAEKYQMNFLEGNAKTGLNIKDCFMYIANNIYVKLQNDSGSFNESIKLDFRDARKNRERSKETKKNKFIKGHSEQCC